VRRRSSSVGAGTKSDLHRRVGLRASWRVTYGSTGTRVIVAGEEAFTLQPGGLSADARFSLSVDLADGLVTRLLLAWEAEER
jgi:hypothetical protein